jgi:hypothetical protein
MSGKTFFENLEDYEYVKPLLNVSNFSSIFAPWPGF